jgi:hypothetical protein
MELNNAAANSTITEAPSKIPNDGTGTAPGALWESN